MAKAAKKQKDTSSAPDTRFASGLFQTVIDKCEGCDRVKIFDDKNFCNTYTMPEAKWRLGLCNFATHVKPEISTATVKINPLKASKRAMGKK
ncbi:PxxKW family cysteine-rich protein [Thermodesulfobacteriota bacterium]